MKPQPIFLIHSVVEMQPATARVRFKDGAVFESDGSVLPVTKEMALTYGYGRDTDRLAREWPLYLEWLAEALGGMSPLLRSLATPSSGEHLPYAARWAEEQRALAFAAFVNQGELRDELMDSLIPLEDAGHRLGDLRERAVALRKSLEAKWG